MIRTADAAASQQIDSGAAPGLSIAVTRDGKILLAKGYGYADVAARVPATASSVFRIGSVTKQFTAAAIMDLVDHARLGVDDEVVKFLPDYPTNSYRLTVRQLLTHTSGITNDTDLPSVAALLDRKVALADLIRLFAGRFDFAPGQQFEYSNSNYLLLGLIIERITGQSWIGSLAQRIFGPLGMRDTVQCPDEPMGPKQAKGYKPGEGDTPVGSDPLNMQLPYAAGALCSTVQDLARWNDAFYGHRFLSAKSYQLMTTPATLENGSSFPYGFGLQLATRTEDSLGLQMIHHGGEINGFASWLAYLPDRKITIAVLSNNEKEDVFNVVRPIRLSILAGR